MESRIIQTNLNHAREARRSSCVAEPYRMSDRPNWVKSTDGLAAIVRRHSPNSPPLNLIGAGRGYVVASWGPMIIISVYLPPSLERRAFCGRLGTLERHLKNHHPQSALVAEDFNAKSAAWGSPRTDWRGDEVMEWAAQCGLVLLNRGQENTCVRSPLSI